MLTLTLLRHAKSSWDNPGHDDFSRPLNARGLHAAPEAGRALRELAIVPSLVLCSPSQRTRETLRLALPEMHLAAAPQSVFEDALYLAPPAQMLDQLRKVEAKHASVLLIGHNPGMHNLAEALAGPGGPNTQALNERLAEKFPTGAIAVLTFNKKSWRDVAPRTGRLTAFWTPKK
jgi:phosphohistidine phosphatase